MRPEKISCFLGYFIPAFILNPFSMPGSRGRDRGSESPPLKITQIIGFLSNTGPDPLKNHKATKLVFNFGHHLNGVLLAG